MDRQTKDKHYGIFFSACVDPKWVIYWFKKQIKNQYLQYLRKTLFKL